MYKIGNYSFAETSNVPTLIEHDRVVRVRITRVVRLCLCVDEQSLSNQGHNLTFF